MKLFKNRYFLLGNLLLIILAIPLTLFLIKRGQELRSSAAPLTTLAIEPATTTATTCQNPITMDVMVDPDKNLVSIVDMYVIYDATKLQLTDIVPNQNAFPLTLRGPTYASGKANISLSIGSDVTKAVQTKTKVATLKFKPLAATSAGPVTVSLDKGSTRVFSLSRNDQAGENVLLNAVSSNVTVTQQANCAAVSGSPTPPLTGTVTLPPGTTATPTPTTPGGGGRGGTSPTPTTPPLVNQAPVCSSLTSSQQLTGTAPYTLGFTANGTDADNTISSATFSFGDGTTQIASSGAGLGTSAASPQVSHTYTNPGTYQAAVMFTDVSGAVSSAAAACSKTIIVSAAPTGGGNTGGSGSTGGTNNGSSGGTGGRAPTPTLPASGSTLTTLGIIGGTVLTIIGGIFLLAL